MKKRISCIAAAVSLLVSAVFAGGTAAQAAGTGYLPDALIGVAEQMAAENDARFLAYDVNGDGSSELAVLYCEGGQMLYCWLFGMDMIGNPVMIFCNDGELLAGSPECSMVEVSFEGAIRLAYRYHNFNNVRIDDYTIFVPGSDGTVTTRTLRAEEDVAGAVGYSRFWQDGAEISAEQFHAVHDAAVVLASAYQPGSGMAADSSVTLEQLKASAAQGPAAPETAPEQEAAEGAALLEMDTSLTELGANIDAPDIATWRSSREVYTYGVQGELVREELYYDGKLSSVTDYRYDGTERLTGKSETWSGGGAWTVYGYDSAGRMVAEVRGTGPEGDFDQRLLYWKYTYDETGCEIREEYGIALSMDPNTFEVLLPDETAGRWSEEYYYNDDGSLARSYTQDGRFFTWRYYDGRGNMATEEFYSADDAGTPYRVVNYENTYDAAGHLIDTSVTLSSGEPLAEVSYIYAGAGPAAEVGGAPPTPYAGADQDLAMLQSYWMENIAMDWVGVFGDVDRDGRTDFVYVDEPDANGMRRAYVLTVKDGSVRSIQLEEGSDTHLAGYLNLFVKVDEATGQADIITMQSDMYQGYGSISFVRYCLDASGNKVELGRITAASVGADPVSEGAYNAYLMGAQAMVSGAYCLAAAGCDDVVDGADIRPLAGDGLYCW